MSWLLFILAQIVSILILIFFYIRYKQTYWKRHHLAGPEPEFLFGNSGQLLRNGFTGPELEWSQKYGKIYGTYIGTSPTVTITDAVLIKQVLVKDFHLFVNRRWQKFPDPIWDKNYFIVENEEWKKVRSITSPSFTTGKLRSMHRLMNECVNQLCAHLDVVTTQKSDGVLIDVKQVMAGFTIDVIATAGFATKTNSNATDIESRSNDTFLFHALNMFRLNQFKSICNEVLPHWLNWAIGNPHTFVPKSFDFFVNLSRKIIQERRKRNQSGGGGGEKRNDLIQLMMDAFVDEETFKRQSYDQLTASIDEDTSNHNQSNGNGVNGKTTPNGGAQKVLTETEIIAHSIVFFIAGYETTATSLSYILYELALNPDVQDRLVDQLRETLVDIPEDSAEYYDIIMNRLPYLNAVIKESMRKYPPVPRLERRVAKDGYMLDDIQLFKDQLVEISVYAVHHSPEYYPEPERFNPDRFMPENKHLLVPYTHLPFGDGPRNCVGLRFAYQTMKLCLAKMIRRYRVAPDPKRTPIPIRFATNFFLLLVNDLPLRVEQRL